MKQKREFFELEVFFFEALNPFTYPVASQSSWRLEGLKRDMFIKENDIFGFLITEWASKWLFSWRAGPWLEATSESPVMEILLSDYSVI